MTCCEDAARLIAGEAGARPMSLILMILELARGRGSTCVPRERVAWMLEELGAEEELDAVSSLIDELSLGEQISPIVVEQGLVYSAKLRNAELRVAAKIRSLLDAGLVPEARVLEAKVSEAMDDVRARPRLFADGSAEVWTDAQAKAILGATVGRFVPITGGPGTGKTSIAVSILRVAVRLGAPPESIGLAAPTGRAADRLSTSIEQALRSVASPAESDLALLAQLGQAQTLHRLLGWSPAADRFRFGAENPLPYRRVLIDECSMLDLGMAEGLLTALRPSARVCWLGDADQLPAVGAGAPFADVVEGRVDAVRLGESFRMRADDEAGGHVLRVAERVRAGDGVGAVSLLRKRQSVAEVRGEGVEILDPVSLGDFVDSWRVRCSRVLEEVVVGADWVVDAGEALTPRAGVPSPADRAFSILSAARFLSATNVGRTGVESISRALSGRSTSEFLPGDPVLVTQNDPSRGLVNGDLGFVIRAGSRRYAVFEKRGQSGRSHRAHSLEPIASRLELAHASTVHRAQGQEHDRVALVLGEGPEHRGVTRSLLYTAITRARRSVTIVARSETFLNAVLRQPFRFSGLAYRIERRD